MTPVSLHLPAAADDGLEISAALRAILATQQRIETRLDRLDPPRMLSQRQAAALLDVSPQTVGRWVKDGRLRLQRGKVNRRDLEALAR